jgi:YVTN family beta-propeller protein
MRKTRLLRILLQIAALLVLVAGLASPSRSQTTIIAGNLGAGGTFQSSTGTSWATGPGALCGPVGNQHPCDPANAVGFTIPANGPYIRMTQFKVAINWFAGPNSVNVGLYGFAGPNTTASINSATLLQSFTVSSPAATPGQPGQLVTQLLTTPIMLIPGHSYFLEMTEPHAGTVFGWQWNNQGQSGYYAAFLPTVNSTPSWFAETCEGCATPAFEVDGVSQGPLAYVTNQSDGTVSVIDTSSGNVVATIPLPCIECTAAPAGLAVTPNGKFVYVAIQNQGTVAVIDTSTNTVSVTIQLCSDCTSSPAGVAITPDGTRAYVTDTTRFAIEVIDTNPSDGTAYNTVTATIMSDVGNPNGPIAISPDGLAAYYTFGTGSLGRIDTTTNSHTTTLTVGSNPSGVAVTPDSAFIYVANKGDNTVSVIQSNFPTFTPGPTITVGSGPYSVAITPDGKFAYVVNQTGGTGSVISTATNTVTATVSGVGTTPNQIAIAPDGRTAYVAVGGGNSVSPISTATNAVSTPVPVGAGPFGVAIGPAPTCTVNDETVTGCETATLDGSAQTVTLSFDNGAHSIAFTVPAGWCSKPPCTATAFYTDTPDSVWQTESANYPGTHIAPIAALGGDGAVYTVTCTDSTGAVCSSPLDYTTTMRWQSTQTNFCESGPALGKEETTTWENILGTCSDLDVTISGNSAPKLSRWAAFFGVTGTSSASVTITTPANGATYVLGETVLANYSCSGTSAECAGTVTNGFPIDTSSLGMKTFTAEASALSGPSANATSTYNVTSSYHFIGFSSPVKNPPDLNIVNAGRAIPIQFQVLDANNNPVLNLTAPPVTIGSFSASCASLDTTVSTSIPATTATGGSGFQNLGGGFYQFNWATLKTWAGTCRQLQVNIGDGVNHVADFQFK